MSALHNGFNHLAQPAASTSTGLSGITVFSSCRSAEAVSGWLAAEWVDPSLAPFLYDGAKAVFIVGTEVREHSKADVKRRSENKYHHDGFSGAHLTVVFI